MECNVFVGKVLVMYPIYYALLFGKSDQIISFFHVVCVGVKITTYLTLRSMCTFLCLETLRKYPPTFALFRKATQTYHVPNDSLTIEKGQKIVIPIYSLHYDPKYFADPEVFDPERFSAKEKAKRISGTYLPFGDGPRICIGT